MEVMYKIIKGNSLLTFVFEEFVEGDMEHVFSEGMKIAIMYDADAVIIVNEDGVIGMIHDNRY